jgi:23S rRNA (adenine2503-C2)-methyltransferase
MGKTSLCGLTVEEIFGIIKPGGFTKNHALKISHLIYKKGFADLSSVSGLSGKLRDFLSESAESGLYPPVSSVSSSDGTTKYLFRTPENRQFETVIIPDNKRCTVCVSTQSGCRMGCSYCMTARYGYHGNLSAGEIINQVISFDPAVNVTHVVFMGMGEPMDNLENVLKACDILTAEWGAAIARRNITVSTVGITDAVVEFINRSDCNLTLSLYSPFPEEREKVIPAEEAFPARETIRIMKDHPLQKKRRFSVAYIMIKGNNDTDRHLSGLIDLIKGSGIRVNLLPYHPVPGDTNISTSAGRMMYFKHNLVSTGISASVRRSRGADINAACGMLAGGLR